MNNLANKSILLGVSGGIAAYKSCQLLRLLVEAGAEVRVVMTESAKAFITPLTMQALSGNPVRDEVFDTAAEAAMGHIELARWADLIVIAPATANTMARLAHGQADDLLSTLVLATSSPVYIAPAMNQQMWQSKANQHNLDLLKQHGYLMLGPDDGAQACGDVGPGRMLEPEAIAEAVNAHFSSGLLAGQRLMITAGPTREAIDPVRYISNRSSGKMGYALAAAAAEAGAEVTLISGPSHLPVPEQVQFYAVSSTQEMHDKVMQLLPGTNIFIAAAAVADYTVLDQAHEKIKKNSDDLTLTLSKTPDILAAVARQTPPPFTVGFAAETHDLERHAKIKLNNKQLDMIAANWVGPEQGFDTDDNALEVFWPNGHQSLALMPKPRLARELLKLVAAQMANPKLHAVKTTSSE